MGVTIEKMKDFLMQARTPTKSEMNSLIDCIAGLSPSASFLRNNQDRNHIETYFSESYVSIFDDYEYWMESETESNEDKVVLAKLMTCFDNDLIWSATYIMFDGNIMYLLNKWWWTKSR